MVLLQVLYRLKNQKLGDISPQTGELKAPETFSKYINK